MKLWSRGVFAAMLLAGISAAHADGGVSGYLNDLDYFAGAGIGITYDPEIEVNTANGSSKAGTSFQYRVFGGAWGRGVSFVDHFGAEIGYTNLGSFDDTVSQGTASGNIKVKSKAEYIDVLAAHDFGDAWRVYAKLGLYHANTDFSESESVSGTVIANASYSSSNIGAHIGVGGEYHVLDNLSVRAVGEYFDSVGGDSAISTTQSIYVATVAAVYNF